ncbi:Uncharacterised protein [Cronobacter sakazakii]|nr:Uncharacterised protein [Cronobacter sakazakii]
MHDTMTNRGQLCRQLWFLCQNSINDEVQRFAVSRTGAKRRFVFAAVHFPFDTRFWKMETFGQTGQVLVTVQCIDDGKFQ